MDLNHPCTFPIDPSKHRIPRVVGNSVSLDGSSISDVIKRSYSYYREICIPFLSQRDATMVMNSLSVDRDPKDGKLTKTWLVKDNILQM